MMASASLYGQSKIVNESVIYSSDTSPYKKEVQSSTFFEVETFLPVCKSILDTTKSSKHAVFYYIKKEFQKVSTDVSYVGGNESLREYQDSLYWANYNGDEVNGSCLYTILFDDKLKIREIRIIKRDGYDNSKFDYDGLIKKILLSTEGKWQRDEKLPSENWYFTMGRFMVR
ncbi:hypothetical protein DW712_02670 [Bacteroides intestinalis]|uniref:TonB C-terminal domain-containing protein n=2 Tax=Bacteroides intestinalis TaxID=329854 RepID=A0A414LJ62_9BACE|nr:hypothetical protein DW712_02670 [Bacteroides intestinalis]